MRLSILQYGDPILRAKGKRIEKIDDRICELAQNMIETMHAANGVGLAAPQVGESLQLTVLDVSQVEDRPSTMKLNGKRVDPNMFMPLILINPELSLSNETELGIEGCLSIPDVSDDVSRARTVKLRARNLEGPLEIEASDFLARALQHEIDHLNGILFIDRLVSARKLKWNRTLRRLEKEYRARRKDKRPAGATVA